MRGLLPSVCVRVFSQSLLCRRVRLRKLRINCHSFIATALGPTWQIEREREGKGKEGREKERQTEKREPGKRERKKESKQVPTCRGLILASSTGCSVRVISGSPVWGSTRLSNYPPPHPPLGQPRTRLPNCPHCLG